MNILSKINWPKYAKLNIFKNKRNIVISIAGAATLCNIIIIKNKVISTLLV
jgi:hypothetical protein